MPSTSGNHKRPSNSYPPRLSRSNLAQLRLWLYDPVTLLLEGAAQHGSTFWINVGPLEPFVVTDDEEIIQQIFQDPVATGADNFIFEPVLGQQSLIVQSGEAHRQLRAKLMPFFQGKQLRSALHRIYHRCEEEATLLNSREFDVRVAMESLTLKVIIDFIFGPIAPNLRTQLIDAGRAFLSLFRSWQGLLGLLVPFTRFQLLGLGPGATISRNSSALKMAITKVMLETTPDIFTGSIIESFIPTNGDFNALDLRAKDEIFDLVSTLLFAGFETTSSTLSWCLYHLGRSPTDAEALRAEVLACTDPLELTSVAKAHPGASMMTRVYNETLRRYPIAPNIFFRTLTAPMELKHGALPAGTMVAPSMVLSHLTPRIWGDDAQEWRPERFNLVNPTQFQFFPFGGGIRRCLGAQLASVEITLFLHALLTRSHLQDTSPTQPRLRRAGITLLPLPAPRVRCDSAVNR